MGTYYLEGANAPVTPRVIKDGNWLTVDYKRSDDAHNEKLFQRKQFEISGLALEFSRIKKDRDIVEFANKYGLLGVNSTENLSYLDYDYYYLNHIQLDEKSRVELIVEWYWHVRHVNKLLKLFDALQNSKPIEDKLLILEKNEGLEPPLTQIATNPTSNVPLFVPPPPGYTKTIPQKPFVPAEYRFFWEKDKKPTLAPYLGPDEKRSIDEEYRLYAWLILDAHIKTIIEKTIIIDFSSPRLDKKAAFGISYTDRKATKYLLAAIYYDLYRIVNNIDEVIFFCPVCGGPYKSKRKGTLYCSNACKQIKKREAKDELISGGNENG